MSVKSGVMMQEGKNNTFQVLRDKVSTFQRKVLRLYLQYVNPKLAKTVGVASEPKSSLLKLMPINLGVWLTLAIAITGLLVWMMPEKFWNWQIVVFLSIFLLGPVLFSLYQRIKSTFYNLLVAYPGKHLLAQEIILEQPIVDGAAEVTLHGENWVLKGDDCEAGRHVSVIAIKENVLFVTPVSS